MADPASTAKVIRRVNDWKLKLIDLSRRNRLINFSPTRNYSVKIEDPTIDSIFERLVVKNRALEIRMPQDENRGSFGRLFSRRPVRNQLVASEEDPRQLERIVRNLVRRSTSEYRERGVRILYITFGLLSWREAATNLPVRSPIILTPIEITRKSTRDPYRIHVPAVEEEAILNPALRLKLQYDHKIELPPLPDFETQRVSEYLKKVEETVEDMGWELEPSAQIGLFSFQKLVMYQDLADNIKRIAEHPIVQALAGVAQAPRAQTPLPSEEELDLIDPRKSFQVLDADSSQQLCIQYALAGQSFVMHGPPGTGKSQTISNLISEFIANGKSVLFVSEKMAALEVVHSRLKAKNLDDYCLELHSHKANKREVVAELNRCLTEHLRARGVLTDKELERLMNRREQLNAYVRALHELRTPLGMTSYQLFGLLSRLEETPFVPTSYPHFKTLDQGKLLKLEDSVSRLSNTWAVVEEGDDFPWKKCTEERFTPETRSNWIHLLDTSLKTIEELADDSFNYTKALGLPTPKTVGNYERLQTLTKMISSTPKPPRYWFEDADLGKIQAKAEENRGKWETYWSTVRELRKRYDTRFLVLPPGIAERVERAWNTLGELLSPAPEGDGGLLLLREELMDYLRNLPAKLQELYDEAHRISGILGIEGEIKTLERIRRLSDLARLCQEKVRPLRSWLESKALEEAKHHLGELKENHARRDELRERLASYNNELLYFDLDQLIEYFEGPGSSIFRVFRPSYYKTRKLISSLSKDGGVPHTILEDLKTARELKDLLAELDSNREKYQRVLGAFYKGEEPDFEGAERALRIAMRAIRIIGKKRAPKALRDNLCAGTSPNEELVQASRRLHDSLSTWSSKTRKLKQLVLFKQMPTTGHALQKSALNEVEDWANEALDRLSRLERASAEALATRIGDHPATFRELVADLRNLEEIQSFEDEVEDRSDELAEVYGGLYSGLGTDWDKILSAIGWTTRFVRTLTSGVPKMLKNAVSEGGGSLPPDPLIAEKWGRISSSLDDLEGRFEPPSRPNPREALVVSDLKKGLGSLRSRIDDLQIWVDFKSLRKRLEEEGLGEFLDRVIAQKADRNFLVDIFRKAMYQGLLDMFFDEDPALKGFRGRDHEQLIRDFQVLDRRFIQRTAQRIIEIANKQKPQGVFVQAPDSEITILMREAAKKRRHMPLRNLFEKIPNLIRRLKPCLMMSPISVSQFLIAGGLQFDLVVFDEASQIYTEDAIGSIYRGNQLVVAGDPKQLPPTPFFQYTVDEDFDWDEEAYEFDLFDSVLDECMSIGLPVNMLRWHYRSKHDSLISFSNDRFYDGRLVLFPASNMGAGDLGLEFVHVRDGVYDRGGTRNNPREAEVVADLVFDHFERHPEKTLGVVTFSIAQMNTVQDSVESRIRERPEFEKFFVEDRLNGFFVKNLENVQGDERDVMIFSVGYGYDQEGRITMNFGPLNKPGGERRLNVAITRAREKVVLVSSIRHDDVRVESTQAEGVRSLHHYLRYAEKRPKKMGVVEKETWYGSPLELDVTDEVEKLGYETVPWVGSSSFRVDIGVVDPGDPGRYILGIMCDGDNYKSAGTARDRDRLRLQVLEGLGWRIHKIWSPDWVQRRKTEVKRLKTALKEAERDPTTNVIAEKPVDDKRNEVRRVKVLETPGSELPEVKAYRLAKLKPKHLFNGYSPKQRGRYLRRYHSEVRRLLPQLVRVEGPVHRELTFIRINSALRLSRATKAFREVFDEEVRKALGGAIDARGDFLWPKDVKGVDVRVPLKGVKDSFRPIRHIPPEEIRQAMLMVARHSIGLSAESLIDETARLLGFKRIGSNILLSLSEVYEEAKNMGRLALEDGLVVFVHSKKLVEGS